FTNNKTGGLGETKSDGVGGGVGNGGGHCGFVGDTQKGFRRGNASGFFKDIAGGKIEAQGSATGFDPRAQAGLSGLLISLASFGWR
ncbi:MAG: hypothetical protein LBD14_04400, partial [Puniceicoccales bacterium]|nr:hypothetical protein [Puniceicoccales bacterium]